MLFIKGNKKPTDNDQEIIAAYKKSRDKQTLGILFERYSHLVFGVCMKYLKDQDESKDAVLSIFEKLMDDLLKYEVKHFSSWLHSVARNYCLMQLRNKQALQKKGDEFAEYNSVFMENGIDSHLSFEKNSEEDFVNLDKAIAALNTEQKICIELFYLKGKCYQEVAELTGYGMNEVKSYIQNGKRNLKIYLMKLKHEHS